MKEEKLLDWHMGDIEQRFGFKGGKYTDVNAYFSIFITLILSGIFFICVCNLPESIRNNKIFEMIINRGWTPYAMVCLFFLSLVILLIKWRKLQFQKKVFKIELIPVGNNFALTSQSALEVIRKLNESVDDPKRFVLFNRIERALLNLKNVGNLSDVSEMLRAQAENDESHMDSSYGILSGIVWVVPILGFIGTVIGLSGAIGGFGTVLNTDTNISSLRDGLIPVTSNLGIAFDTTYLALVFAMIIQMIMTILRKQEEQFLDACRDYVHEHIISRLKIIKE